VANKTLVIKFSHTYKPIDETDPFNVTRLTLSFNKTINKEKVGAATGFTEKTVDNVQTTETVIQNTGPLIISLAPPLQTVLRSFNQLLLQSMMPVSFNSELSEFFSLAGWDKSSDSFSNSIENAFQEV
jgi:hypothetical protein